MRELGHHNDDLRYEIKSQPLDQMIDELSDLLKAEPKGLKLRFLNPKSPAPLFEGELFEYQGETLRFRSLRAIMDIAKLSNASFNLLSVDGDWCVAHLHPLPTNDSWHKTSAPSGDSEKYGAQTTYGRLNKQEDPITLRDLRRVYRRIALLSPKKILALGCNQGDELWPLWGCLNLEQRRESTLIGIDHSLTAIEVARSRYPQFHFEVDDISRLDHSAFKGIDLLISLNVLHSPSLDGHALFKSWVKELLNPQSAVLVGLPNCRYHGHEVSYGAVSVHGGTINDMSQMLSEVQFYTRYLRQQGFTVWVTGEHTFFILGRRS